MEVKGEMITYLRFIGVTKDATTAGPGKRLELFTKGCIRGVINPCKGCFNECTWTFEGPFRKMTIKEAAEIIERDAWNRQVTFCGGEPILQGKSILKLAKYLKRKDPTFHFVLYTAYKLHTLQKYGLQFTWVPKYGKGMLDSLQDFTETYRIDPKTKAYKFTILTPKDIQELMKYIDIIVDGDYQEDLRLTDHETMHEGGFIGSSNQRVIFCKESLQQGNLCYLYADEYDTLYSNSNHCKACGHIIHNDKEFCNKLCKDRYEQYKERIKHLR